MVMAGKVVRGKQLVSICRDCIKAMAQSPKAASVAKLGGMQGKVASKLDQIRAKPNLTISNPAQSTQTK